jgi:hypothetical protein
MNLCQKPIEVILNCFDGTYLLAYHIYNSLFDVFEVIA